MGRSKDSFESVSFIPKYQDPTIAEEQEGPAVTTDRIDRRRPRKEKTVNAPGDEDGQRPGRGVEVDGGRYAWFDSGRLEEVRVMDAVPRRAAGRQSRRRDLGDEPLGKRQQKG